jgi:hypothetical protein
MTVSRKDTHTQRREKTEGGGGHRERCGVTFVLSEPHGQKERFISFRWRDQIKLFFAADRLSFVRDEQKYFMLGKQNESRRER